MNETKTDAGALGSNAGLGAADDISRSRSD